MWFRLLPMFLMVLGPRFIPRLVRTAYVVWKLIFDTRVPLLLKLLLPATLLVFPLARVPLLGLVGFVLLLSFAVFLLLSLSPRHVVESYAPWRARNTTTHEDKQDPSRVVEGSYSLLDEEEPGK